MLSPVLRLITNLGLSNAILLLAIVCIVLYKVFLGIFPHTLFGVKVLFFVNIIELYPPSSSTKCTGTHCGVYQVRGSHTSPG